MSTNIILSELEQTTFYIDNLTRLKGLAIQLLANECSQHQRLQLARNFSQLQNAMHNNLETVIFVLRNMKGGE